MNKIKYVVGAARQKDYYWWGGPKVGFTSLIESALGYVGPEVAKLAAEVVDAQERQDWPNMLKIVPIMVEYKEYEAGLALPGMVFAQSLKATVREVVCATVVD